MATVLRFGYFTLQNAISKREQAHGVVYKVYSATSSALEMLLCLNYL